jgi:hypothetical protein
LTCFHGVAARGRTAACHWSAEGRRGDCRCWQGGNRRICTWRMAILAHVPLLAWLPSFLARTVGIGPICRPISPRISSNGGPWSSIQRCGRGVAAPVKYVVVFNVILARWLWNGCVRQSLVNQADQIM